MHIAQVIDKLTRLCWVLGNKFELVDSVHFFNIERELRSREQEVDNRPEVQSQHTRIETATSDKINTFGLV
jgi:hypothetical protein